MIALEGSALKLLPLPVVSSDALLIALEPSVPLQPIQFKVSHLATHHILNTTHLLKFVTVIVTLPSAPALTAVLELTSARLALPHGLELDGLWTSLRAGVPFTPRAGAIAACALTWVTVPRRRVAARKRLLENIAL